jgi:predicted transcriptional regulator
MTREQPPLDVSRRERQILGVIYRLGRATATEVSANLPDPPSPTAVRTMLRILEQKGHLRHERDGTRHIYSPTLPHEEARRSVLSDVIHTFFNGSPEQAMAALLDLSPAELTDRDLNRMLQLIEQARQRKKRVRP